jgi:FkbM family methyltransferase
VRGNIFVDPQFDAVFDQHPLVLVDVGARGGLKSNWAAARRHLRVLGFEPDPQEYNRLVEAAKSSQAGDTFFNTALHNHQGSLPLYIARDRGLSSVFEPNREFVDAFPDAERFDTVEVQQVQVDTLDNQLRARGINDLDFVKVDTQGSELFVLEGGSQALAGSALGAEIEVEFAPIYKRQPLFADVDRFMRDRGFLLFDVRPCYWKRAVGRGFGGSYGQIIWADALYLKSLPALRESLSRMPAGARQSKLLRAISVALLYGYWDFAIEIAQAGNELLPDAQRTPIEHRLRELGAKYDALPVFPGRRSLAALFRRLWKVCRLRNEGWSVSDSSIGNLD